MLVLCLMFSTTYYAQNYAGVIGLGLLVNLIIRSYEDTLLHDEVSKIHIILICCYSVTNSTDIMFCEDIAICDCLSKIQPNSHSYNSFYCPRLQLATLIVIRYEKIGLMCTKYTPSHYSNYLIICVSYLSFVT